MPIPGPYIREEQFKLSQTSVMVVDNSRTVLALAAAGQEVPKELLSSQGQLAGEEANLKQSAGSVQELCASWLCADNGRLLPVCREQQKP